MPLLDEAALRERVVRLAAIDRPSASPGERRAAELIAAELRDCGARVRIEEARVHGTYWWPIGLLTAAAALAGLARRRGPAALVGAIAAAGAADDVTGGAMWFRRLLGSRTTANVVAEFGAREAERTLVFVAHHDAARTGLVFHPELPRAMARRFPRQHARTDTSPPTLWGAVGGPALVALGALAGRSGPRRFGALLSAGYAVAMADIGRRSTVPGANDNLSAVAVILSLAHALEAAPPPRGLRVVLVSTGAEESFQEGMQAFGRRHFPSLPLERTHVICLDTVGSPQLALAEGEGMLWMNEYPRDALALIADCARECGVALRRGLRIRNASDGLIALRAGYPAALIGSVDEYKFPTDYHWPTDTPERLHYGTVAGAARVCWRLIERFAGRRGPEPGPEPPPSRAARRGRRPYGEATGGAPARRPGAPGEAPSTADPAGR